MSDLRASATTIFTTHTKAPRGSIFEVVEGQNAVVVIGRDEVLRLPRTPDAAARLDLTARLGRVLGPRLPIPIAQPRIYSTRLSDAGSFSIERRLPGQPLSPVIVSELPTATQRSLARQLFAFLQALHGIDLGALRAEAPLPAVNPREEWHEIVRRARTELAAWWSPALEQRFLDEAVQFEATVDDGVVATLRHGDFGGANILFDRETQQVTAILDFELAAEGDPVYDYASASTLGPVVAEVLFDAAGLSASQRRRTASYRAAFPLQEALFAVAAGDLDDVPRALAAYDMTERSQPAGMVAEPITSRPAGWDDVPAPPPIAYRRLEAADDLNAITRLLHEAYAPLAAAGMRYVASHQDVGTTSRRLGNGETFVAVCDEAVVGIVTLAEIHNTRGSPFYERPDVASFGQFAVLPARQRQGIGSRLINIVEARAREKGVVELALDTSEHAEALIAMYARRGYRFIEYAQWGSVNYRSVILSKRLG